MLVVTLTLAIAMRKMISHFLARILDLLFPVTTAVMHSVPRLQRLYSRLERQERQERHQKDRETNPSLRSVRTLFFKKSEDQDSVVFPDISLILFHSVDYCSYRMH